MIKLLLVEDDKVDQMAFERLMKKQDQSYNYEIAGSFNEAREKLADDQFDIIITDYSLGDGNGIDIMGLQPKAPVIFITGSSNPELAVKAMKLGAYDYVIKDQDLNYLKILPYAIESTLKRKEETDQYVLLRQAIMSTRDSVYITDLTNTIIFVNAAFSHTYGYTVAEIIGKKTDILEKNPERKNSDKTIYHKRKDNTVFPVSLSRSPVPDEEGKEKATIHVSRDITELKNAEEELRKSQMRVLELQKDITERQMAGGFAHEMRNALSGAKLVLGKALEYEHIHKRSMMEETCLILEKLFHFIAPSLTEERQQQVKNEMRTIYQNERTIQEIFEIASGAVSRGLDITHQIMNYSEIGSEKRGDARVNLNKLIREIADESRQECDRNGIKILLDVSATDIWIQGLENHFYSIVKNLVNNSRDALLDRRIDPAKEKKINISLAEKDGQIEIKVEDNGIGISPKDKQKIFEAFFSTKPDTGTGLGLSVVKKTISLYNGQIQVDSTENTGSVFTLIFPATLQGWAALQD